MKYRICWRSKLTGVTGHGDWLSKDIAEAWLEKEDTVDLEYWLEKENE